MKKQFKLYMYVFVFFAMGMHFKQWISHPIDHLMDMAHGGAYGVPGIVHPFVFTFLGYIVLLGFIKLYKMVFR